MRYFFKKKISKHPTPTPLTFPKPSTKGLVAELTPPHVQSAWGFKREWVQAAGLAACCNYFSNFFFYFLFFFMELEYHGKLEFPKLEYPKSGRFLHISETMVN